MARGAEVQERAWASDKYGEKVLSWKWDWRDERILRWIANFERIAHDNTLANIDRLNATRTGKLRRALAWKTWAASGGDAQVFEARYIYYAKFLELAVGKGDPYKEAVPAISEPRWLPIRVPSRRRKAKPHVVTELRSQAAKFTTMVRKQFTFTGTVFMIYAAGSNQENADAINRAIFWASRRGRVER